MLLPTRSIVNGGFREALVAPLRAGLGRFRLSTTDRLRADPRVSLHSTLQTHGCRHRCLIERIFRRFTASVEGGHSCPLRRAPDGRGRRAAPTVQPHPGDDRQSPARASAMFEELRTLLPAEVRDTVDELEDVFEEERQLRRQSRLHHLLHDWLLLHVPLSLVLLLLGVVHAVMSLRY